MGAALLPFSAAPLEKQLLCAILPLRRRSSPCASAWKKAERPGSCGALVSGREKEQGLLTTLVHALSLRMAATMSGVRPLASAQLSASLV